MVLKSGEGVVLMSAAGYIGHATNNVAEYRGLMGCLELVEKMEAEAVSVFSDSELLVKQVRGVYRVKKPHLKRLHEQVLRMIREGGYDFQIHHIPREENRDADGLARRAIRLRSDIDGLLESP